MSFEVRRSHLKSPSKFLEVYKDAIDKVVSWMRENSVCAWNEKEVGLLILSAIRSNDFDIVSVNGDKLTVNEDRLHEWISAKLIPNTVVLPLDDEDIIRLLIFSLEITYQMFGGGSRATVTQKGFRDRRRTFESILVDQFTGKLGEVAVKKFIESKFSPAKVELDWRISRDIEAYRGKDILNARHKVSIKTTSSLEGIWAEAEKESDYGIFVKVSLPQAPVLQFFVETCGMLRIIDFAQSKIKHEDATFKNYIHSIRQRLEGYQCGKIKSSFKCFVYGYFRTENYAPVEEGIELEYLGEVKESRYLVRVSELLYSNEDWYKFIQEVLSNG